MFEFKILKKDKNSKARLGEITTPHGIIETPAFVPVATKASFRGLEIEDVEKFGAEILMMNTFHLFCKGQNEFIKKMGGLHKFANTSLPIMTDSGGFQVFSQGFGKEYNIGKHLESREQSRKKSENLVKIDNDHVLFRLPADGRILEMNPEISIKAQKDLGSDIVFAFDECASPVSSWEYAKESLDRTNLWAKRSLKAFSGGKQAIMGIAQGGDFPDLRKESAEFMSKLDFFGYGIGGSFGNSFGDSKRSMYKIIEIVNSILPENKFKHLLGIGEVDDIFESIKQGADTFDCVIPTRWARHGTAITSKGKINIRSSKYLYDKNPLDKTCSCHTCQKYTRSYLSHLTR